MDLLFPPACAGCGVAGSSWCNRCQAESRGLQPPFCEQCGQPSVSGTCEVCADITRGFDQCQSFALYQPPLSKAIVQLKYSARGGLGDALAEHLIDRIQELDWQFDLILPVPLGSARRKNRGFNQAEKLTIPLRKFYRLPRADAWIAQQQETVSQVGLNREARRANVELAFQASPAVKHKRILIVDDVIATGSTIDACGQTLRRAGASYIYGLTLARASSNQLTEA